MKFNFDDVTIANSDSLYPILCISYDHPLSEKQISQLEIALEKSGFGSEIYSGTAIFNDKERNEFVVGSTSFIIDSDKEFDWEFCHQIVSSVIGDDYNMEFVNDLDDPSVNHEYHL